MSSAAGAGATGPVVVEVHHREDVATALAGLGLAPDRRVLVSVGGAGGLGEEHLVALRRLLAGYLLPVLAECDACVVDGGTHSGVMRLMGEAVVAAGPQVPLLGVAAAGTVLLPGRAAPMPDAAELDPHHAAVLLVPGQEWGDESPWIASVAAQLCGRAPSVTLVVNGGEITYDDVRQSVDAGRPVVVAAGTGRTADAIAAALTGAATDARAAELARSGLVQAVDVQDGAGAARLIGRFLRGR